MQSLESLVVWPVAVTFPQGLVGVPAWQHFALEPLADDRQVWLLHRQDDNEVCFLVVDPAGVTEGYNPKLEPADLRAVEADSADGLLVVCTARIDPRDGFTVNLLGPLLINPATGLALQLVLYDSGYVTDHPTAVPGRSLATAT